MKTFVRHIVVVTQQVPELPHSSKVLSSILNYLCGFAVHVAYLYAIVNYLGMSKHANVCWYTSVPNQVFAHYS